MPKKPDVRKKNKVVKTQPIKSAAERGVKSDQTNSFDFGGLPERDLKKNLGCG